MIPVPNLLTHLYFLWVPKSSLVSDQNNAYEDHFLIASHDENRFPNAYEHGGIG